MEQQLLELWNLYAEHIETAGLVVGLLVVFLLIMERVAAWPLGTLYVLLYLPVLYTSGLYSNFLLHLAAFLPLNLYGWYRWTVGKGNADKMPVTHIPIWLVLVLLLLVVLGILGMPYFWEFIGVQLITTEDPEWVRQLDDTVLMLSLAAMYVQAQKHIEAWMLWFVINIMSIVLYNYAGIDTLMYLYMAYLVMAVWGYLTWYRSLVKRTR